MQKLINVFDYRELARKRLSSIAFDYLERGAEDEVTLKRNREIFAQITYRPRVLTGFPSVDLTRTLFGRNYKLPLVIGATGFAGLFWPDGDQAVARAAGAAGIPYVLPTLASTTLEEIPSLPNAERWFQIYPFPDDTKTDALIAAARSAGYTALVLTVDSIVGGKREASMRRGANVPMPITLPLLLDVLTHPRWAWQMLRHGRPTLANVDKIFGKGTAFSPGEMFKRTLSWNDVMRMRGNWPGTFIVKGIQSVEDARIAVHTGVNGIVVSNHGGRQLDGSPSAIESLPRIVEAVGKDATVMVDGGVQRGGDVVKAIALGAEAVWLGRTPLYGLGARGEAGVSEIMNILRQEMEITMVLLGVDRLRNLRPDCVQMMGAGS